MGVNWFGVISIAEALLILGIVWKASALLAVLNVTMGRLSTEITVLNVTRVEHISILSRVVERLDNMDERQNRFDRKIERLQSFHRDEP